MEKTVKFYIDILEEYKWSEICSVNFLYKIQTFIQGT